MVRVRNHRFRGTLAELKRLTEPSPPTREIVRVRLCRVCVRAVCVRAVDTSHGRWLLWEDGYEKSTQHERAFDCVEGGIAWACHSWFCAHDEQHTPSLSHRTTSSESCSTCKVDDVHVCTGVGAL